MTGIIVNIDSSDPEHLYKTNKFLRKYFGQDFDVKMDRQSGSIELNPRNGGSVEDVEAAMEKYVKTLGKGHGGCRFGYEVSCAEVSQREILEREIRGEYDSKILEIKAEQARLEAKWSKERLKYQDDIRGMRERELELKVEADLSQKEAESFETELFDTRLELNEEKMLSDNLSTTADGLSDKLQETYDELEALRKEHEEHTNTPLYKLFFRKIKDIFSK